MFPFFCVSKCWYSCYFTSTRAFLHQPAIHENLWLSMSCCTCVVVKFEVVWNICLLFCPSLWCMTGISRSQIHLSLQQRRQEERRAETTENRHQTMDFNCCFAKRNVYWLCFNYLLLLNVIIGFGYCNHWNLTHNILLGKEKSCVQLVWNGYYCTGEKVFS